MDLPSIWTILFIILWFSISKKSADHDQTAQYVQADHSLPWSLETATIRLKVNTDHVLLNATDSIFNDTEVLLYNFLQHYTIISLFVFLDNYPVYRSVYTFVMLKQITSWITDSKTTGFFQQNYIMITDGKTT